MTKYLIDLFCGIGGVSTGFKRNGYVVALAVDLWKEALTVHESNYPRTRHESIELGTPAAKRFLVKFIKDMKLTDDDHLHIHASPPCQQLSKANVLRKSDEGLVLTTWTIKTLMQLQEQFDCTWSIEQVPHVAVIELAKKSKVQYDIYMMSKHGVCQKRKRLIMTSCPELSIAESPYPSIETILTPPKGTKYITNMTWRPSRKAGDTFQGVMVELVPEKTIAYTILKAPCWFLNSNKKEIRRFSVEDNMAIQSFPDTYFNKIKLSDDKKRQMVANAVPPTFAYHLSKAIDRCVYV